MISKALTFVSDFLNHEIKMSYGIDEDRVVISSLINPDGTITENIENKIVISVINLEHETTVNSQGNYVNGGNNNFGKVSPPVYLNIYLLISANYDSGNYIEALKMLSTVIGVFQANTYFTQQKNPTMPSPLEKLTFEIFNLPINELSHIWSGIGAKYVPSIVYKVRMISIREDLITKEVPGLSGVQNNPQAKTS
ncbi:MAG: DUF4255 domain-containing protein [Flavobacteriales bacterium]|jgi:hypothetical protein|nr:MAG: hypothetical protein VR77_07365 [Flavobacteriales bacterium BRH_c54]KJS07335.1 MAG: hypothetical protein VR77_01510 [Flavobacteriales bacterium BRH_c54]MBL1232859.1 DUF4255 domain-containing protein [Flavobacteriales bacterium]MBQ19984.1 DUF4255 domain-containing protein [Flavobacteriales bacterium]|tara:strand:- start:40955 stop:41539 length:585 start_codon:yes stop_codon:yes gene_type:complete